MSTANKNIGDQKTLETQRQAELQKMDPTLHNKLTDSSGNLNNAAFNKEFQNQHAKELSASKTKDIATLNNLNKTSDDILVYKQNIYEIIIGIVNTWFGIINDLLMMKIYGILEKDHRMFYFGLTLVIFALLIYIITELFDNTVSKEVYDKNRMYFH